MEPWMVVVVVLVLVIGAAALSDRRDRRNGLDPKIRAERITAKRQQYKDIRGAWFRRRLGRGDDRDPHERDRYPR